MSRKRRINSNQQPETREQRNESERRQADVKRLLAAAALARRIEQREVVNDRPRNPQNVAQKIVRIFKPLSSQFGPRYANVTNIPRYEGTPGNAPDMSKAVPTAEEQQRSFKSGKYTNEIDTPIGADKPRVSAVSTAQYQRNLAVKSWVLKEAKGICECCSEPAPFFVQDGTPYLEIHHVVLLSDGGADTINNTVALCPNCHREIHHGVNRSMLIEQLYKTILRLNRY